MMKALLTLFVLAALPVQLLWAEGNFLSDRLDINLNKPLYFGLDFGLGTAGLREGSSVQGAQSLKLKTLDDSDMALGLVMGMRYSDFLDLEMRYQNVGSFEHQLRYLDTLNAVQVNVNTDIDVENLVLAMKPSMKVAGIDVGVELGLSYVMEHLNPKVSASGTQSAQVLQDLEDQIALKPETISELSLTYGFYLGFKGDGQWEWRYSAQTMTVEDDEFAVQSISVIRHFRKPKKDTRPDSVQVASHI